MVEEALHDMVFIIGQKEKERRRGGEAKPSQRKLSPKGFQEGVRKDVGQKDEETRITS